ncbi:alpha/beta hydrolase family protein [Arenimonas terrae]|uniref:Alpha/beta fold hydrolase n=1 Tax=Arenimonas terrae TaxID=2546226 RepID=A0A5C4RUQ8_9GAMM|nr:alpha/beta fold hydrolase [Arenimonas terrae]TNJ34728.1 alpha/beta fold hydrolase [Arenimonas terrae]
MTPTELPVAAADGHRFRLRRHGLGARGLFWIPALGVPAQKYDPLSDALAGAGFTTVVHEWRGMGSSSLRAARSRDWGYTELLRHDLAAAITALDPQVRWAVGGHSLGGQFAAMLAAERAMDWDGLVLAATGLPLAATFPGRQRLGVQLFARVLPALTAVAGYYPGHRLGFAGREAGQVMRDWADTVRSGHYRAYGGALPLDAAMRGMDGPVLALRFSDDWLVPEASLQALLAKLGRGPHTVETFDAARLGATADHFRWMRQPAAVAARIAGWLSA